jgi:thioesterase-3
MKTAAEILIRGYHCDSYAHVNNARYLELLEEARWRALEEIDEDGLLLGGRYAFFISKIELEFLRGLVPGDLARIGFRFDDHQEHFMHASQEIRRASDNKLCTKASLTFVLMDRENGKKAIPDERILELFKSYVE